MHGVRIRTHKVPLVGQLLLEKPLLAVECCLEAPLVEQMLLLVKIPSLTSGCHRLKAGWHISCICKN